MEKYSRQQLLYIMNSTQSKYYDEEKNCVLSFEKYVTESLIKLYVYLDLKNIDIEILDMGKNLEEEDIINISNSQCEYFTEAVIFMHNDDLKKGFERILEFINNESSDIEEISLCERMVLYTLVKIYFSKKRTY